MTTRTLITGASGYIGHHLARALIARGDQLHAISRADSNLRGLRLTPHTCDTTSLADLSAILRDVRPNIIFHLAGCTRAPVPDAIRTLIDSNIIFTAHLAQAALAAGCPNLIMAGSYWEYGEESTNTPRSLYAATKRAAGALLDAVSISASLRAITLILFDVYGPLDWRGKLLPRLLTLSPDGPPLPLSSGLQHLDFIHIDDVVRAFLVASDLLQSHPASPAGSHQRFAIDTGHRYTLLQCIATLEGILARPLPIAIGALPPNPEQIMEPVLGLPRLPGWNARMSLEDGLRDLAAAAGLLR